MNKGGAPLGNTNAVKKRLFAHGLYVEAMKVLDGPNPRTKLQAVCEKMFQNAMEGETAAANLIMDRVDGKLPTPISGEEGGPIKFVVEVVRFGDGSQDPPTS